jgi:hypothetical protein
VDGASGEATVWSNVHGPFVMQPPIPARCMPYRTPPGGVYDSGDHPALLDALLRDGGHAEMLAERDRLGATGRLAGVGMAMIVDPSGTNLGYIDLARTPEERGRGLGKSGCTESATLSMNPMGGVRLRIATAPEGQGHETVAAQIVADELGVAREMILRGRRMLAEEALHCGLVCEVTAPEDLRAAALRIAGELAARSPLALATLKSTLNHGMDTNLRAAMEIERKAYAMLRSTHDYHEGVTSFFERREPEYTGR